jgi:excisionase family DNA binding protein
MEKLYTTKEICERLNIDRHKLYKLIHDNLLQATRIGTKQNTNSYRIKESDLNKFLKRSLVNDNR